MGSMMMSTFLVFVPREVTFLFLALCCVGFFGIFLPWQERKKKKAQKKSPAPSARSETVSSSSHQLEQLETLKKAGVLTQEEYEEKRKEL